MTRDQIIEEVSLAIRHLRADADSYQNQGNLDHAGYLTGRADDLEDQLDDFCSGDEK